MEYVMYSEWSPFLVLAIVSIRNLFVPDFKFSTRYQNNPLPFLICAMFHFPVIFKFLYV